MQDLSLHILDVAENGIRAGANLISIKVDEDLERDRLSITIEDNGSGMKPDFLETVLDPFVTTRMRRTIGLGLPLFQQAAKQAGGELTIDSVPGRGTRVTATMSHSHIDRKPMGDVTETVTTLIQGNPEIDVLYTHRKERREYFLDTREIRRELEHIPMNSPEVVSLIHDNLMAGLEEIGAG